MKIIEFLGAPGVGKSTLYQELCRRRKYHFRWYTLFEAKIMSRFKYRMLSNLLIVSKLLELFIMNSRKKNHLKSFINNNELFFHNSIDAILKSKVSDYRRITTILRFLNTVQEYELLKEKKLSSLIICDEFFTQRVFTQLSKGYNNETEIIRKYFLEVPLPTAIIHMHCEASIIADRIIERLNKSGHLNYMNKQLSRSELQKQCEMYQTYTDIGASLLSDRGVAVLSIDAGEKLGLNLELIISFINELLESK